ncbi:SgcJ/EcaC family oxidoreductase [Actinomadura scrupuli]|uniref:SgcJ/EcaC family oxidoreductase n=1 Tax=Actinomadura scrupuli TaxID=559629 RepID=UPI003D97A2E3
MTVMAVGAAVRDLYTRLLRAWNDRNAEDYAALFAADGVMIGFDGSQASGAQITDHLAPIFTDHPTAAFVAKVRDIRFLGPGSVMLRAIAGMVPPGQDRLNPAVNVLQTIVAEHQEDGWRIVLFQNTPAQYHGRPELTEQHTAELEPLLAGDTIVA